MSELEDYVKEEFYELNRSEWSDSMVKAFIAKAITLDTNVYEAIADVYSYDLIQIIAEFDLSYVQREIMAMQKTMKANARCAIDDIIDDIQYQYDVIETEKQENSDWIATEARAINRERNQ